MLRAILAAVCAVCLIYSPSSAKKTSADAVPTVSKHQQTTPADAPPDARFAMAAANTTVLYSATFNTGALCNEQGWTKTDLNAQTGAYFHVDDFVGVNVNPGDAYAPIAGAKSLWCGARASSSGELCAYLVLPGSGNNWNQAWRTKNCIPVAGNLDIAFDMHLDSEPDYDYVELEYTAECDADFRSNSWTLLAGGVGVWDGALNINHAASYAVGPGPVEVRIRFFGDGGYSDEDNLFDSHSGPVVVDNLAVEGLALEDFEGESVGATASNDWEADADPGFGTYFALFPGSSQVQQDACAKNLSCVWAAISGSTETYACGGFPQQAAVPKGNDYGQYIHEAIASPLIPVTGSGSRLNLQFSVYRDLSLYRSVFYNFQVRDVTNGCPGPWMQPNYGLFGDQKDWKVETFALGGLVNLANASHIQVRLLVEDFCATFCGLIGSDPCHSHAPLFDNVKVYRVDLSGPVFAVNDYDMFQDTFPVDGTDTGIGRADMARDIAPPNSPTVLPGDSVMFICRDPVTAVPANLTGLADDVALGGRQCYLWVRVIDSGVPSVIKSGAALTDNANYPFKDTQVADGKTWTRIRCRLLGSGVRFIIDLNDNLFQAGDEVQFFFGATNTNGQTTYCSGSALDYVQDNVDVAAASASEFTILPLQGNGTEFSNILYVDGMDGRGAQVMWDTALRALSVIPDRYDVRGPTSNVANRPSTRVTDVNQQLNANYQFVLWDTGDLSTGLGDGSGSPEKSNDYAMLNNFLAGLASPGGVYIAGDDAPSRLLAATGAAASTFRSSYITYSLTTGDHRSTFGVNPLGTGVAGSAFAGRTFYIFGGCPLLNDFDVMTTTGSTVRQVTYGPPGTTNAALISKNTGNARVGLSGFSPIYVRDDHGGDWDRAGFFYSVFCMLGDCFNLPTDAPRTLVNRLEQNYPNPFNPQTTIAFSLKERGRVRIDVFNVAGELVSTLLDEARAAGSYTDVRWDGADQRGQRVASGVYWYRITAGSFSQSKKMVLLK